MASYILDGILKTTVFWKICWRGHLLHSWGGGLRWPWSGYKTQHA